MSLPELGRLNAEKILKEPCIALQLRLRLRCSIRGVVETTRYSPEALRQTGSTALSIASAVVGHGVLCAEFLVWTQAKTPLDEPAADWPLY